MGSSAIRSAGPTRTRGRGSGPVRRLGRWALRVTGAVAAAGLLAGLGAGGYLYITYAEVVDARLHGQRERTLPRVFARPMEIRRGQLLSQADLVARLNDLGYAQREAAERAGEFAIEGNLVSLVARGGDREGELVQASFAPAGGITRLEAGGTRVDLVRLDAPLLTALMAAGARQKRRHVPLDAIPERMRQAVLAIEDQAFYSHPGINPVRLAAAAFRNAVGRDAAVVGYSTITQQLARMFFLADEFNAELRTGERGRTWASYWRKLREGVMSIALEQRTTKDELLELYLNDIYLGQRGSFAIHGVAEASRIFFGKDVSNISLGEAALVAGTIRLPGLPFVDPERARERRNLVLRAMHEEGYVTAEEVERASREPLQLAARAVDNAAPYFVDMVAEQVARAFPGVTTGPAPVDVYTTLDLNMQRAALDAVRAGLGRVDDLLAPRRPAPAGRPQAALIAVDPRTGEILAMVGGRSYNSSQFNRAIAARRQPGSVFKPFVFLAAFEQAAEEGRTDLTPASLTMDAPTLFMVNDQPWEPGNYDQYDGEITWRRALAMSRNLGTINAGQQVGFDRIAAFWRRLGIGAPPLAVPAITLGVFELSPIEVAEAYTVFVTGGSVRPLRAIDRIDAGGRKLLPAASEPRPVARPDTTFLVTNMLRGVLSEGTAASVRAAGFALDAAGKTGTTNDLRDAWFAGFTPELLAVVWVGFDDNTPLGLSGAQAALPIWTDFMRAALAGRPDVPLAAPDGISWAEIDRDTGKLALPTCPRTLREAFLAGTEPDEYCPLHRW